MAQEKRDNSGIMFKNDKKDKPTHADWRGEGMVNGKEVWINCWEKQGKKGIFYTFAFKPKQATEPTEEQAF